MSSEARSSPSAAPRGPSLKVLVVEDDQTIAGNLLDFLAMRGHRADVAYDGLAAIERLTRDIHDVIVLDLGLPRADGLAVLKAARERLLLPTPVLVLTARDALESRLDAFAHGADDYVNKPFALAEVEVRLVALHRRATGTVVAAVSQIGSLRLDRRSRTVTVADRPVRLMPRSLTLLERLMRDPGELVDRRELERLLWPDEDASADALRSQLYLLRKALLEVGYDGLETVHGQGVRMRP